MMAANNYFGFTHGGTQYGAATPTAAYGGQTGYAVAPAATAATYSAPRAAATGYDSAYQAAAATQAAHAQAAQAAQAQAAQAAQAQAAQAAQAQAAQAQAAQAAYDASKSYYQQQAAAYPSSAPSYESAPAKQYTSYAPRPPAAKPYAYAAPYAAPKRSAYDAALYSAATMYVAQQGKPAWKGKQQQRRTKPPPKAQQLHYCDVCRISCAGPQTYKEHLEGQKHKKKEAAGKAAGGAAGGGQAAGPAGARQPGGASSLRCELCDVTCTGADAYAAHVRGIKHQKVVKLHTMLGKPIPSAEPTKLQPAKKTVAGAAKIAFVSRGGLSTVGGAEEEEGAGAGGAGCAGPGGEEEAGGGGDEDVQPVGQDYIDEVRADDGKSVSFHCKLCDCRFNDPNAKEMHMKGRRHRLQYKKKVQPDLVVNVKPNNHQRKLAEQKALRMAAREELWARRDEEWGGGEGADWWGARGAGGAGAGGARRPDTADDRLVAAKHAALYPTEAELQHVQRAVSHTERALKALSDALANAHATATANANADDKGGANKEDGRDNQLFSFGAEERALKGVMRVGLLAKGLLLKGDRDVRLVVLCRDRPTVTLLKRVATELPAHLAAHARDHKYRVDLQPTDGAVTVTDNTVTVRVALTSPLMRDAPEEAARDDKDVLPRAKCLDALAALRHAKWFQARAASLQSCVIVLRVLRELCRRVPTWAPLPPYGLELLVAGALSGAGTALQPGEAFRRVLEAVSGGLVLEAGPGVRDVCEKDSPDALAALSPQQREDLTASAQHFLRLMAFRQLHKVLDIEPLPSSRGPWRGMRKRRRSQTEEGATNNEHKLVKVEGADK